MQELVNNIDIYYYSFFKNAGITYDVSQPHVEFNIFEDCYKGASFVLVEQNGKEIMAIEQGMRKHIYDKNGWALIAPVHKEKEDVKTQIIKKEHVPTNDTELFHYYHRIDYIWVLQNTLLTSLMQEPTEFYSFTCTYNGDHDEVEDRNVIMSSSFHWFLVFHILVSWIFLGVFISLIYQKFRNM